VDCQTAVSASVEQLLELATEHHLAGRLAEAELLYQQVIAERPDQPDALHRLGVLTWQTGDARAGLELIGRAIQINPGEARYHCSSGQVLFSLNDFPQAIAAFERVLKLKPDSAEALFGLALALHSTGQRDLAIPIYRHLIALRPDHVEAHNNLGNALQATGHLPEAIDAYRRALAIRPDYLEALNNLGGALQAAGKIDDAIQCFICALSLRSDFAPIHNNLGNALAAKRQFDDAAAALRHAVLLQPEFAEAWYNLANVLREQGHLHDAVGAYRKATEFRPDYVDAHVNLGNILQSLGDFAASAKSYLSALSVRPDHVTAHSNLSNALRTMGQADEAIRILRQALALRPDFHVAYCNLGNVLKDTGRLDEALACFRKAIELKRDDAISHSNLAYSVHFHPDFDGPAILRENLLFNNRHAQRFVHAIRPHVNDRDPDRRLRIGYVSPDFRDHCQSLFTVPLLSNHDHARFEVFCYANVTMPDTVTERIAKYADHWRPTVGLSDAEVAEQVAADEIDILIDLTMHMSNGRPLLFARRPAPIQVAYLAYPSTTGLSAMDYRLTDPYLDPPGETDYFYSEKSIRLPDTFWCYDPLTTEPAPGNLPAIERGFITFGCLNNFCKVNDTTLALWASCLSQVKDSRLLLLCPPGSHRQHVLDLFATHDIAAHRIEFAEYRPREQYLELYRRIDLGLDTFPYNGHTTSLDSFWMGVPVVARIGRTAVGRAGWSQLCNLGLRELAAENDEVFIRIATSLASNLSQLTHLRSNLRERLRQSPLMDASRFAKNVEQAFRQMWQNWCVDS
jgi:protein O-GlcNAc transferase